MVDDKRRETVAEKEKNPPRNFHGIVVSNLAKVAKSVTLRSLGVQ